MQVKRLFQLSSLLCALVFSSSLYSQQVTLQQAEITLTAELEKTESFSTSPVILMTHGTLAHSKMEIMSTLQELLAENGISSLAINLSLGVSDREGMYDCPTPHTHKHEDAKSEIGLWKDYLKAQGATNIVVLGHSRGGNQTAQFAASNTDLVVTKAILIAPMTWNAEKEGSSYKEKYGDELSTLLSKANTMAASGKAKAIIEKIDFIYCEDTSATAEAVASYYKDDSNKDTPTILSKLSIPTLVLLGSEDKVVADLPEALTKIKKPNTFSTATIDGADHFFRDLYADEVIEHIVEFLGQ